MPNTCVCCGVDIPEGLMICPKCEEERFITSTISNKFKKEKNYANQSNDKKD